LAELERVGYQAVIAGIEKYINDLKRMQAAQAKFAHSMAEVPQEAEKAKRGILGLLDVSSNVLARFNLASQGIMRLTGLFRTLTEGMLGGNAAFEQYETGFAVLLKGSNDFSVGLQRAKERMAELADFAAKTPFELPEIVQASKMLQTFGGDLLATGDTLTLVGDMAAAAGVSFGEIAIWVGRAYTAMQSGRPFGEAAMRLQELGLLSGEARNKMEELQKSGASAKVQWENFTQTMSRFSGMMKEQSQTMTGLLSTLRDDLAALQRTTFAPVLEPVKQAIRDVLAFLESAPMVEAAKQFGEMLGDLATRAVAKLPELLAAVQDAVWRLVAALRDPDSTIRRLIDAFATLGSVATTAGFNMAGTLLPLFANMVKTFEPLLNLIARSPAAVYALATAFMAIKVQGLISSITTLATSLSTMNLVAAGVAVALVGIPLAVNAVTDAFSHADEEAESFKQGFEEMRQSIAGLTGPEGIAKATVQMRDMVEEIRKWPSKWSKDFDDSLAGMVRAMRDAGMSFEEVSTVIKRSGAEAFQDVRAEMEKWREENRKVQDELAFQSEVQHLKELAQAAKDTGKDIEGLGDSAQMSAEEVEKQTKRIESAVKSLLPAVDETFDQWAERIDRLLQAYSLLPENLKYILGRLVDAHVDNAQQIVDAISKQGPEVAWAFAYYLAQVPADSAAEALRNFGSVVTYEAAKAVTEGAEGAVPYAEAGGARIGGAMGQSALAEVQRQFAALPRGVALQLESAATGTNLLKTPGFGLPPPPPPPPRPPSRGGAGGGGAGGGGGREAPSPEDIMKEAASAASSIAGAIQSAIEAFRKLEGFDTVNFDKLRRLSDSIKEAVLIFAEGINEARLEATKQAAEWAQSASSIVGVISTGVSNFDALDKYGGLARDEFLRFVDDFRFAAETFVAQAPQTSKATTYAAALWAEDASKIVGVISDAVEAFSSLKGYSSLARASFDAFTTDFVYAANRFVERITSMSREIPEAAVKFASSAKDLFGAISNAVSGFELMRKYSALSRSGLEQFVDDFVAAANVFAAEIKAGSSTIEDASLQFAAGAGALLGTISNAVSNFASLRNYQSVATSDIAKFVSDFVADSKFFADSMLMASYTFQESALAFAAGASSVLSVISGGVQAFASLKDYEAVSAQAMAQFADDFISAARTFADKVTSAGLTISEATTAFAEGGGRLVGVISSAVSNFKALDDYRQISRTSLEEFVDDFIAAVGEFKRQMESSGIELGEAADTFADSSAKIFAAMGGAFQVFEAIRDYGSLVRTTIDALVADLVYAAEAFATATADWDEKSFEAAGKVAESARSILELFSAAADAFSDDFFAITGVSGWIYQIITVLTNAIRMFVQGLQDVESMISAEATQALAGAGATIIKSVADLVTALSTGRSLTNTAIARVRDLGRALVDVAKAFMQAAREFDRRTAETGATMASATATLAQAFVAMQGDLRSVRTDLLFGFVRDIIDQFGALGQLVTDLRNQGLEHSLTFLAGLVDWIRNFLRNFGISFQVPEVQPPQPQPQPQPEPKPPEVIVPDIEIPLLPEEIQEIIRVVTQGLVNLITGTSGALNISDDVLQRWIARAELISTLANSFLNLAQAVSIVGREDTQPFFTFLTKFLNGLNKFADGIAKLAIKLEPLGDVFMGMATIVQHIDKFRQFAKLDQLEVIQGAEAVGLFVRETLRIVSQGVSAIPEGALKNMVSGLAAITDFINAISAGIGTLLGPLPSYQYGTLYARGGPAILHPGEIVLPPELSAMVREELTTPMVSTTTFNRSSVGPIIVNIAGNADKATVREGVMEALSAAGYNQALRARGLIPV